MRPLTAEAPNNPIIKAIDALFQVIEKQMKQTYEKIDDSVHKYGFIEWEHLPFIFVSKP